MWEIGRPNLIWRWAPCGALALGAVAFASFVTFAIPDRIGDVASKTADGSLYATTLTPAGATVVNGPPNSGAREQNNNLPAAPLPRGAVAPAPSTFPKRGFSPPLERVETRAAPVPAPVLQQPELNIPPPAQVQAAPQPASVLPPPAAAVPPPQPELVPQPPPAQPSEPPPAPAESAPAPASSPEPPTAAN